MKLKQNVSFSQKQPIIQRIVSQCKILISLRYMFYLKPFFVTMFNKIQEKVIINYMSGVCVVISFVTMDLYLQ